jgi:hypothetical protein
MKKLLILLFLLPTLSFSQIIINQEVVEAPPYQVGDTITIRYTFQNLTGQSDFRYFWLRFHYSNKHLQLVPNSTQFVDAATRQTYFYQWVGYSFNSNPNIGVGELDRQLYGGGFQYVGNQDWNVVQLNMQATSNIPDGEWVRQKFIIKDQLQFNSIHKLHLADAKNSANQRISPVGSQVLWLSLNNVSGASSAVTFRVAFPAGYDITKHNVQILNVNTDNTPNYNSIVTSVPLDGAGQALLTTLQTGKNYFAQITFASQQSFMNDIVTVADAYKAFLQISDKGLNMDQNYFTTPIEYKVGNVTIGDDTFDLSDSYNLFAHVMGIDVSQTSTIPTSTSNNTKFYSGKIDTFNQGIFFNGLINIVNPSHTFDFGYAWAGDLDFSHSTPKTVTSIANRSNRIEVDNKQANTTVTTKLVNGKVVVEIKLEETNLAGAQYKIKYDASKLELEEVVFDAGRDITNFSTPRDNAVVFGSIDNTGTSKVKPGMPYKLVFKPKTTISNTTGLTFIEFAEAVAQNGDKIILNIQ